MKLPARFVKVLGEVEYRDEGEALLSSPGDVAIVHRACPRSVLISCPDGCNETLVINLDPRAGKAWRLDMRGGRPTLFPSIWRDGGCGSHFILWRGCILWCGRFEEGNIEPAYDELLEGRVLAILVKDRLKSTEEIADALDEIPWEVMRAGRVLVKRGLAVEGVRKQCCWFARP